MVLYVGHCHVQSNLDTRSLRGPGHSLATSSTYQPLLLPSLLLNGFHISVSQPPGDRIQSGLGFYHRGLEVILLTGELIVAEGGGVLGRGRPREGCYLELGFLPFQAPYFLPGTADKILPLSCWESPAHLHRGGAVFPREAGNVLSVLQANFHDSRYCL